jgi:hypothetical protein
MYNQIWIKYLAVIRILVKRSATGDQLLSVNQSDFDRSGKGRKAGFSFNIEFKNGLLSSNSKETEFARAFIDVIKEDDIIKSLISANNYAFVFTSKFQLRIKNSTRPVLEAIA